ncbi:TonB-dependent receptor [Croceicoccus sp. F390]|uniref:TonB-dependent receptor n=1 Tax=Croceicoccus esteveae TaxID=3075597 RepID=A0ABU2ZKG5_9SPHN|nr:TonB-dependent receptor [Croceicoccus sp. F390]MDT0577088.1 TonB-dependent receptor [Croceicoccus sp. F390]
MNRRVIKHHLASEKSGGFPGVGKLLLLTAACLQFPATALAQEQEDGRITGLDEIVVTAQKRAENLQDTPLAITALSAEMIAARGISDVGSLSAIAPNLIINQTPESSTTPTIYIRGIGQSDPALTLDAPNAVYIDGVVIGRSAGSMFELVDLERIEVLRGPQGTLFGRNTTGGAISLITARPAQTWGVEQTLGIGGFNLFQARTTLDTGELADSGFSAKFSYLHKQRHGYVDNILEPGRRDPGAYNVDALRAALSYDAGGPVNAFYSFDYNMRNSRGIPVQLAAVAPYVGGYLDASAQLGGAAPQISRSRLDTIALDFDGPIRDRTTGHTLIVEAELSEQLQLRSTTGYRDWSNTVRSSDLDGNAGLVGFTVSPAILAPPFDFIPEGVNPVSLYNGRNERKQHQWSQELNLVGKAGSNLEYVLGAYYFKEKAQERDKVNLTILIPLDDPIELAPGITTPAFGVNISTLLDYRHKSESKALFGQATYQLADRLSITGGLRYTWDKKTLNQTEAIINNAEADFGQLTWLGTAKYDFSNDISSYVRVATGYKSGGFNPRGGGNAFDPEKVTSYEAGLKTELFDRRIRLNLAGFHTIYKNLQVSQFEAGSTGANSITVNAGKATYTGVEAEFVARLTNSLTFSANGGYVDRDYKEYLFRDPVTDELVNLADEARFNYSASTTATAGLEYRFPNFDFGSLKARLDYDYRSRIYYHQLDIIAPFNKVLSDGGVSTLNGRMTLSDIMLPSADMSVALWVKNLTDEDYLLSGTDFGSLGFGIISFAEPRTWGLDLTVKFR